MGSDFSTGEVVEVACTLAATITDVVIQCDWQPHILIKKESVSAGDELVLQIRVQSLAVQDLLADIWPTDTCHDRWEFQGKIGSCLGSLLDIVEAGWSKTSQKAHWNSFKLRNGLSFVQRVVAYSPALPDKTSKPAAHPSKPAEANRVLIHIESALQCKWSVLGIPVILIWASRAGMGRIRVSRARSGQAGQYKKRNKKGWARTGKAETRGVRTTQARQKTGCSVECTVWRIWLQ